MTHRSKPNKSFCFEVHNYCIKYKQLTLRCYRLSNNLSSFVLAAHREKSFIFDLYQRVGLVFTKQIEYEYQVKTTKWEDLTDTILSIRPDLCYFETHIYIGSDPFFFFYFLSE